MPERPVLILPTPSRVDAPRGGGGGNDIRFPSKTRQTKEFGPVFSRLRNVLNKEDANLQLRRDPTSLSPDRVIVFEIAGSIENFLKAIARIDGLEFMAEQEIDFHADEHFVVLDDRKGKEGQVRIDKVISGRFYLAMPDVQALKELVRLWDLWRTGKPLGRGYAPFSHLFQQLRALRPWGPQDRIPDETIAYWREEIEHNPNRPVRTEVEFWFRNNETRRRAVSTALREVVAASAGTIVHEAIIPEIAYHGALIDIPVGEVQRLIAHQAVRLALADDVMFLRPQTTFLGSMEAEPGADPPHDAVRPIAGLQPIAALFDGVPVQAHSLLDGRIVLDDPDELQARSIVRHRRHGTAMSSLILHGDRNEAGNPIQRPLYVRPILVTSNEGQEHTDRDTLVIDTLYRAVVRMKGTEGQEAAAPTVFLVNLSMGDVHRPFTGMMSPLARLLDFLSDRYGILFFVSGGNVTHPLTIPDFREWTAFEQAEAKQRERAVLKALNAAKHERTILSPAESLNAVTIGAQHHDHVAQRQGGQIAVDPFEDNSLPNISSGLGLGYRRMIKPEIYLPGGREFVRMRRSGDNLEVAVTGPQRLYGLKAAAPDPTGQGRLDYTALSDGTSSATALGTRAAHQIFDALMDRNGGSMVADIDSEYYAVLIKCLFLHTARWNGNDELLKEICGPEDKKKHIERSENSSRFIGFGIPDISEVIECSPNRATLVGVGVLPPDSAHLYRIPLPACLERVTDPRSLTVTVAWISPVKPAHQSYRCIRLEAAPVHQPKVALGVKRRTSQPSDNCVKRGSVFHEQFHGAAAVPFVDDGHLAFRVWCKEDAGVIDPDPVRYSIAVTLQAETPIPVYDQIQQRLLVRPQARG